MIRYIPVYREWQFRHGNFALNFSFGPNYGWRFQPIPMNGSWKHGSATFWKFKIIW